MKPAVYLETTIVSYSNGVTEPRLGDSGESGDNARMVATRQGMFDLYISQAMIEESRAGVYRGGGAPLGRPSASYPSRYFAGCTGVS